MYVREIEDLLEARQASEKTDKLALLSSGRVTLEDLFPEQFADVVTDDSAPLDDDGSTTYVFGQASYDPNQADALVAKMLAEAEHLTVNGANLRGV